MKKTLALIGFIVVALLLAAVSFSCTSEVNVKASLGEEFTLPVGKTADIDSEGLSIQFIKVEADSRCPNFAKCIQAGEGKCQVVFKYAGSSAEMTLTQLGGTAATGTDYFINFKIDFKLEPYPEIGKEIAPSDYKLVMTIIKK